MKKQKLLLTLLFGFIISFAVFSISVKAAGEEQVEYRCSGAAMTGDGGWAKLEGNPQCKTNLEGDKAFIYVEFRRGSEKRGPYTITFNLSLSPSASPATSPSPGPSVSPRASARASVNPSANSYSSPNPSSSASVKASSVPAQGDGSKKCSNGLSLSAADAKYDVYEDCRINTFDASDMFKHFSRN
jgi:hypothetical protein